MSPSHRPSAVRPETLALVAQWRQADQDWRSREDTQTDDFLDRWVPAAAPLLDAGWNGYGSAPSAVISLRYCMMMTGSRQQREYAAAWSDWVKAEAVARLKRGYHPYPLTNLRPSVGNIANRGLPTAGPAS